MKQDPEWILPIMEYRRAMQAKAIMNTDATEMAKYPEMVKLWRELSLSIEEDGSG